MKVLMRKSISGSEYWDTIAKKTLFVPTGKKLGFEVTKDPKSMIDEPEVTWEVAVDDIPDTNLDDMNTEQLLEFAVDNDIDVPGNMKKEDTIRKYINDQL